MGTLPSSPGAARPRWDPAAAKGEGRMEHCFAPCPPSVYPSVKWARFGLPIRGCSMGRKKLSADANSSPIFWGPHPPDPMAAGWWWEGERGVKRRSRESPPLFFSTFPQSTRSPPPSHARLLPLHQPPTRRSWRNGENKGNFRNQMRAEQAWRWGEGAAESG